MFKKNIKNKSSIGYRHTTNKLTLAGRYIPKYPMNNNIVRTL